MTEMVRHSVYVEALIDGYLEAGKKILVEEGPGTLVEIVFR